MKLLNIKGPQDIMALLVRRKWWIVLPFFALSSAVVLLVFILPKVYVSTALVLIQPRDVPSDLVRNLIAGSTADRLSAIEQTVLSRTNLTQVAREFEEQLPEDKNLNMDDRVAKIRSKINLNFRDGGVGSGQLPVTSFRISYQDRKPKVAQQIAARVTDLFKQLDNEVREKQVSGTTEFFSAEVDKVADKLKESDAKLKNLKARRRNELPTQLDSNLRRLENLQSAQASISEQLLILGDQQRKLDQMIAEVPKEIPRPVEKVVPPPVDPPDPNIAVYRNLKAQLKALKLKGDTEKHPDVLALNRQIDRVKEELSPEDLILADKKEEKPVAAPVVPEEKMPNPTYLTLLDQKKDLMRTIGIYENRRNSNDSGIELMNKRIENEPDAEEDLVDIVRENTDLNKQYDEQKRKLADTKLSETLESKQKGDQFRVVDPANLPMSATKPQKYVLSAAGVALSLLLSIVFGAVVDIANQKMWTLSDVEGLLGVTVLVEIPEIVVASDLAQARRKRLKQIAAVLAVSAVYGVALYFVYLHQSSVVKHLDPYLQRLYQ